MDQRLACLVVLSLAGCAGAELDAQDRERDLTADEAGPIIAELIIDVVDQGRPVIADRVTALADGRVLAEGACIVHAGPDRCKVWSLTFDATRDVTLAADLCDRRHAEPFGLTLNPDQEGFNFGMSVAIAADGMSCADALPDGCGGDEFAEPALSVSVLDRSGKPADVRGVMIRYNDEQPSAADCLEGTAHGCSEWASRRTDPGRYQATVEVCGRTFASSWVDVAADDFGCSLATQSVTVAIDPTVCGS